MPEEAETGKRNMLIGSILNAPPLQPAGPIQPHLIPPLTVISAHTKASNTGV